MDSFILWFAHVFVIGYVPLVAVYTIRAAWAFVVRSWTMVLWLEDQQEFDQLTSGLRSPDSGGVVELPQRIPGSSLRGDRMKRDSNGHLMEPACTTQATLIPAGLTEDEYAARGIAALNSLLIAQAQRRNL